MKSIWIFLLTVSILIGYSGVIDLKAQDHQSDQSQTEHVETESDHSDTNHGEASDEEHGGHNIAPWWAVIPFVALLLMIATGPLFYEHFWHKNYPKIAVLLAISVVLFYLLYLHNTHNPIHALAEYVQFISLLTCLFVASGGIIIEVDKKSSAMANVMILLIGAVIANIIGTTGASMLLIRPFIRMNKNRIQPYHIVFFIFIVSNIGGSLTPIGDPPLFLGFLKGVPFFWTLTHNFTAWIFGVLVLTAIFYFIDLKNKNSQDLEDDPEKIYSNKITIRGSRNFGWLTIIVLSVFLDPNIFDWVPGIPYEGLKISFLREIIMLTTAYLSFKTADKEILKANEFDFEPIREVAFLFVGIFGTMMPALELVGNFAQSPAGQELINHNTLYWGTGSLSGFLDNAPTYLNFLAAGMASVGGSINVPPDVKAFALGEFSDSVIMLKAISIGAVFFGSFTYIGNGPNFMVKSIAEQTGIQMPSFFCYIIKYSIPFLIPLFILT